jgi:hypothetical protein
MEVLKKHCERENRKYEDIEVTVLGPVEISANGLTPEEVVTMCEELAEIGVKHVIFNMPNVHEITPIEIIDEEVIPEVARL